MIASRAALTGRVPVQSSKQRFQLKKSNHVYFGADRDYPPRKHGRGVSLSTAENYYDEKKGALLYRVRAQKKKNWLDGIFIKGYE